MLQQLRRPRTAKRTLFFSMILTAALCSGVLVAEAGKNDPPAKKTEGAPETETATVKAREYMPDGRLIYTSVNQLHNWPKKFKKGKNNKEGC